MNGRLFLYVCWACMFFSIPVAYADEDCDLSLQEAQQTYNAGDYAKAKALFEYVAEECGANYGNVTEWIKKCSAFGHHPGEPEMVFVQGGTFLMGCTVEQGSDCYAAESPSHLVTVSDFYIGKYEITQAQWEAVMGMDISQQHDKSYDGEDFNIPMNSVSWYDVQEFIHRLNALTGKQYRLPTEAEWEYAARGGKQSCGYKYSGSNNIEQVAWHSGNSNEIIHQVGTKNPNELGIYDMSGNVWEWCSDWYGPYDNKRVINPTGANSGTYRVFRGGSCYNNTFRCRVVYRDVDVLPTSRSRYIGFRLVLSP